MKRTTAANEVPCELIKYLVPLGTNGQERIRIHISRNMDLG